MNISGKWVGTAIYGENYGKAAGKRNDFMLDIVEEEGEITGSVIDQECVFVFKSAISVTGFHHDETLSFIRNYPFKYYFAEEDGLFCIAENKVPYEVNYMGEYVPDKEYFAGVWELATNVVKTGTPYQQEQGSGNWAMRRPTEEDLIIFRALLKEAGLPCCF